MFGVNQTKYNKGGCLCPQCVDVSLLAAAIADGGTLPAIIASSSPRESIERGHSQLMEKHRILMCLRPFPAVWLLVFSGFPCGCASPQPNDTQPSAASQVDSDLPAGVQTASPQPANVSVAVADLQALQNKIESVAGKLVVVDIWSTSCVPCLREFPHLISLSRKYSDQVSCISYNVDFIGLKSKPAESYLPKVEQFLKQQNATITNFVSATPDEAVLKHFAVESIPAILLFDDQGKLLHKFTDANSGEDGLTYDGDVIPKLQELLDDMADK